MLSWIQTHPALQANRLVPFVIVLAFMGAAAVGGVVVASGNLLLIGLAVGALLGVLLLNHLSFVVWMLLVGTLLFTGPLVLHLPQLGRLQWGFSILGFFLIGAAIVVAGIDRTPNRGRTPVFVWLAIVFMLYSLIALPFLPQDPDQWAGSIKRYFQFWGLMFLLAVLPVPSRTVRRWLLFLFVLALIQLPFALHQKIFLVPLRHNMPHGIVPVDIVAGTFEAYMLGAGNNIGMVFFLIVVLVTLLAAYREGLVRPLTTFVCAILIAAPLALGETKVALVLLPLALFVVFADQVRRRPFVFAAGSIVTMGLVAGLLYVYVALTPTDSRVGLTFQQRLQENIDYNFGRSGYSGAAALNRGNVVPFWWSRNGTQNLQGTLFGHGLGASHGWQSGDSVGVMTRRYPGQAIGLTGLSALLWDVGILGAALFAGILGSAFLVARRLAARAAPGLDRALCRGLAASSLMLLALLFATDGMLLIPSTQVMMCTTLGLIAWRARLPVVGNARS